MTHPHDNIRVGAITFVYSVTKRGWVFPGLSVIRNPLKARKRAARTVLTGMCYSVGSATR
ncbi:DUF1317 family protein, partial [Escherichia coli]|uniref:DUF1317 family protein n=1 Tax=Escherichia coli TaxID=562 RepID=UPI0008FEF0A1